VVTVRGGEALTIKFDERRGETNTVLGLVILEHMNGNYAKGKAEHGRD